MTHPDGSFAGLAHDREGLGQHRVQRLALFQTAFELGRLGLQVGVGKSGELRFEVVNRFGGTAQTLNVSLVAVYERF